MNIILKKILLLSISILSFLSITSKAIDTIDDIVWVTENAPPDNYLDQNNELVGTSVKKIKNILKTNNSQTCLSDIQVLSWDVAYNKTLNNKNYALFSTARTEKRETLFKWAGPLSTMNIVVFLKKDSNIKITSLNDLRNYKVGVVKNDVGQQLVNSEVKGLKLYVSDNASDNLQNLNAGTIDLMVYDEASIKDVIKQKGLNTENYKSIYTVKEVGLWIAFNPLTSDALVQAIQTEFNNK
jgi:polar amino acid transport system substrate-binding protein